MNLKTLACFALPLTLAAAAQAQTFGDASGFNFYSNGNLSTQFSDTEGRMAVGGNVVIEGYDVGLKNPGGDVLIVGGDLNFKNGTIRGNAVVGGTASITGTGFTNGGALVAGSPLDFSAIGSTLNSLSTFWSGLSANGTAARPFSTLNLTGTDAGVNIFNISAADLTSASDVNILVPDGATALINIAGSSVTLPNFGYNYNGSQDNQKFRKVIWHLQDATSASVNSLRGTLFAPKANVAGGFGAIEGQVFVNSFTGPTQFNDFSFNGSQPVPEPVSLALLAAAGVGLAARRRRMRKSHS